MPDPVEIQLGIQIRILRESRAISLAGLASRIGMSAAEIHGFEQGTSRVGAGELVRIAKALGTSVRTLFEGGSDPESGNDNLPPFELLTKQGLALLRLFHSIEDVELRHRVLKVVEEMAAGERPAEPCPA